MYARTLTVLKTIEKRKSNAIISRYIPLTYEACFLRMEPFLMLRGGGLEELRSLATVLIRESGSRYHQETTTTDE